MATRHKHLREDYSTHKVHCTVLNNVHVQVLDVNCTREMTWIVPQEPGVLVACPRLTWRSSISFIHPRSTRTVFGTPCA